LQGAYSAVYDQDLDLLGGVHEVLEDLRVVYVGGGKNYREQHDSSGRN